MTFTNQILINIKKEELKLVKFLKNIIQLHIKLRIINLNKKFLIMIKILGKVHHQKRKLKEKIVQIFSFVQKILSRPLNCKSSLKDSNKISKKQKNQIH